MWVYRLLGRIKLLLQNITCIRFRSYVNVLMALKRLAVTSTVFAISTVVRLLPKHVMLVPFLADLFES
jgi:hypothetical protein